MRRIVFGLAMVPLLAGGAFAGHPVPLGDGQLDQVTAGYLEVDLSNTSATAVSIFQRPYLLDSTPNQITCPGCYLLINSPAFSVASQLGPGFSTGTVLPP